MVVERTRDEILAHENDKEYMANRVDWVKGKILDVSDYRKISVDSNEELMILAKIGQLMADEVVPGAKLFFTQAVLVGAAMLSRELADKFGLDFEKYRSVLMVTPTRYGKQLAYDYPVPTPSGWKKHGELLPGDEVFGIDGKPIKVLAISKPTEQNTVVTLKNHEQIEVHDNHEWTVWDRDASNGKGKPHGKWVTLETHEMEERGLTTKDKKANGEVYDRCKYYLPLTQPCEFPYQDQPLDAYFVGCWLGDGTKNNSILTLSDNDAEEILNNITYSVSSFVKLQGCKHYGFRHQGILQNIRVLGLYNNKHIPPIYKYASLDQQKQLLAGLIDTDGYVDKTGRVIISCANKKLKDDIIELLSLMALRPYVTAVDPVVSTSGIIGRKVVYQIGFQPWYKIPTHVKRKKIVRLVERKKIGIESITHTKKKKMGSCIQVASPDGMYLVGKSLIPTHNSFLNAFIAIANAALGGKEVRIGGATRDKAGLIQEKVVGLLPSASKEIQDGLVITDDDGDVNKKVQRLATQASKEALAWKSGGSIKLFSTNETKKSADIAAAGAVGVGGDVVLLDEIQIMSPVGFRTASRFFMENNDTKRFCVGNPQINGHFRDLYDDPTTFVVHMNDSSAIIEGRMSRRQMELTGMPTYSNEYRAFVTCEFPPSNAGNRFFTTLPSVYDKTAFPTPSQKISFMGIDSAYKGADSLIVTIVTLNISPERIWVSLDYQKDMKTRYPVWDDTMTTLNICLDVLKLVERYGIERVSIDIGMGVQLYETLLRLSPDLDIEPVAFGSLPTEWRAETDFNAKWALNKRAEMHLDLKELCESQMMFIAPEYYDDLIKQIREVGNSEQGQKIKIEAKKEIKRRLGQSPDALDSLCLAVRSLVLSGILRGENDASVDDMVQVYGGQ